MYACVIWKVDVLRASTDGKGSLSKHERKHVKEKAPGIIEHKSMHKTPTTTEYYIIVFYSKLP